MTDERGVLRRIAWRELFPWLVIFRTFRLSISPTLLAVATLAVFVTDVGWRGSAIIFLTKEEISAPIPAPPMITLLPPAAAKYFPTEDSAAEDGFTVMAEPFFKIFRRELSIQHTAHYTFCSLWSLAIWALAGGIITRRAVVELGAEETPGFLETVKFASRRYLWYLLSPLYPLVGVLVLLLPIAALGLVARITDLGLVLAGLVWIFVILAGLIATWLLTGLLFGFPLMWGTISAEREGDAFEAFSRSFSYVYGKPLHYLFYAAVASLFGALSWAVASYAADMIIEFGFWAFSWGAGAEQAARAQGYTKLGPLDLFASANDDGIARFGGVLMGLSIGVVHLVEAAFRLSFFWCVAGAIYLLMRQDVDDKEMDDVYVPVEPTPKTPLESSVSPNLTPAPPPPAAETPAQSEQRLVESVQVPPQ